MNIAARILAEAAEWNAWAWARDLQPRVLPPSYQLIEQVLDGAKWMRSDRMTVISSAAAEQDGNRWLHVSCAHPTHVPTYADLVEVKELFIGRDKCALMILPPRSKHINIHPNCLHLFHCLDGDVTPDFTRGGQSL